MAACAVILAIMVIVGIFLKFTNPPRFEARHPMMPVGVTGGLGPSRRRQTMKPQLNTSPSQVGLLNQAQPVAMSSQVLLPDPAATVVPDTSYQAAYAQSQPYAESSSHPAAVSGSRRSDVHKKSRQSRALPAPPIRPYSDAPFGSGSAYSDPSSVQNETSPFETHALVPTRANRKSRGYVPLPEPPIVAQETYDAQPAHERQSYYDGALSYYNTQPTTSTPGAAETSTWRNSETSQLSRVESIGAGDYRRHSRRGRGNGRKVTTAERIKALRAASYKDPFDTSTAVPASYQAYSDYPGYSEYPTYDSYATEHNQYPVREEYRYAAQDPIWDQWQTGSQPYVSERPTYHYGNY